MEYLCKPSFSIQLVSMVAKFCCRLLDYYVILGCHGSVTVKMSSPAIEDFTVACEVGDITWIKRCLRSSFDVREHNSHVRYVYCYLSAKVHVVRL